MCATGKKNETIFIIHFMFIRTYVYLRYYLKQTRF